VIQFSIVTMPLSCTVFEIMSVVFHESSGYVVASVGLVLSIC